MPGHHFEGNPVDEGTTRRGTDPLMHLTEKTEGSIHSSTNGLLGSDVEAGASAEAIKRIGGDLLLA